MPAIRARSLNISRGHCSLAQEARQELAARYQLYGTDSGLSAQDRRAHRRFSAAELSWLQVARIKNGPQVRLVDLSAGGVLLETDARMQRNADGLLELIGDSRESVCSFRVLRWEPFDSDRARHFIEAHARLRSLSTSTLCCVPIPWRRCATPRSLRTFAAPKSHVTAIIVSSAAKCPGYRPSSCHGASRSTCSTFREPAC